MNELYFLGMDIVVETTNIVDLTKMVCTNGMNDNEVKAYNLGISNVISALKSVLKEDSMMIVNIDGLDIPTELTVDELEKYASNM